MITPYIPVILFYCFSATMLVLALCVVFFRNPVHSVMSLIAVFILTACLWILMHAEFLALLLVFLYVGAVMTLFLFVVMMLNADLSAMRDGFVRYFFVGLLVALSFLTVIIFLLLPGHFAAGADKLVFADPNVNNLGPIAMLMFTKYIYAFEMCGILLLLAIIAAVALVFNGRRRGTKAQKISEQLAANKSSRLRVINMESSK
jgi:NADH-quinone oxidoreductase subunit J